jgi:uncharacterized membrane protein HdeD (DUF308 family)
LSAHLTSQRIIIARAVLALVWATALVVAIGDHVPTTDAEMPAAAAALLAAYPLIDVIASLVQAHRGPDATPLRVNATISTLAAVGVAATAFGADAAATLTAFGIWAVVSGAIQFVLALRGNRQTPMLISGALSALAGISFLAAAGMHAAHLGVLGGYMAVGAVLYLVSTRHRRTTKRLAG